MKFIAYKIYIYIYIYRTYNGAECCSKLRLPANNFGLAIVDRLLIIHVIFQKIILMGYYVKQSTRNFECYY